MKYPYSWVGPCQKSFTHPNFGILWGAKVWGDHCKELSVLGDPAGALTWQCSRPWADVLPAAVQGGGQRLQALPLPCHTDPGTAGWARTDAANCIPRLLTHSSLSWGTILSLWLCYHFLVGFVRFLSPGSTLWEEECESDRGINVTFRKKKHIVGRHLYFYKGTFDLEDFPI